MEISWRLPGFAALSCGDGPVLRPSGTEPRRMLYSFDDYTIDSLGFQLRRNDQPVAVEPQVFDLLALLVANAGRVVTREDILESVWKGRIVSDAAISSRVKAARRAIGDDGAAQRLIRTVHGRGFLFAANVAIRQAAAAAVAEPQWREQPSTAEAEKVEALSRAVMERPAIGVLPFVDHEAESGQSPRSVGVTEELIAALSAWRWFPVIARNTTFRCVRSDKPADMIGAEIGARYLLTGSIRPAGGAIKLTAALIDAERNQEIWSGNFRRDIAELFEVEEELAREVVGAIEVHLANAEMGRIRLKPPSDLSAWDLAQQANWHLCLGTLEGLDQAEMLADRAAELDPGWSYPYALIAFARFQRAMHSWSGSDPETAFSATLEAARTALRVDGGSWMAHALSGVGELWSHGNHDKALAHLHYALQINPSANWSYHFSGCISGFAGDLDQARRLQPRVYQLDPVYPYSAVLQADMALWWMLAGELDAASDHIAKSIQWDPEYGRGLHRAVAIAGLKGDRDAAERIMRGHGGRSAAFDPDYIRKSYPFRNPDHRELFFDGLRRAGVNI